MAESATPKATTRFFPKRSARRALAMTMRMMGRHWMVVSDSTAFLDWSENCSTMAGRAGEMAVCEPMMSETESSAALMGRPE